MEPDDKLLFAAIWFFLGVLTALLFFSPPVAVLADTMTPSKPSAMELLL